MLTFTIPGKPIGKGRAKATHIPGLGVRMYTPKKTANYEGLIAHTAQIAMRGLPLIDGPVCLDLLIRCEVPVSWSQKKQRMALAGEIFPATKPDADNIIKAVCDGCNGVVWRDDVLAVDGSWKKRYSVVPGVVVTITPLVLTSPQATLMQPDRPKALVAPVPELQTERDLCKSPF